MKKIIVPIDFSEAANNALCYAQKLAAHLNVGVKVIHVAHEPYEPLYPYFDITSPIQLKKQGDKLEQYLRQLQPTLSSCATVDTQLEKAVVLGNATNEIIKISRSEDVEMIVMGTTGAGGIMGRLLGSVSSKVAQRSHCPVLLIPQNIKSFRSYDQVMYASHYKSFTEDSLTRIKKFAHLFDANIHWVHINNASTTEAAIIDKEILNMLFYKYQPETKLPLVSIDDKDIWSGLTHYAQLKSIDLIVLGSPNYNFLGQLFHRSVTKQMVLKAQCPMLVLPVK